METVSIIPEGSVVYGIQLPIQSQSTIYCEDWETSSGPAEIGRIAKTADESGFFYIAVCDHTFIPRRLAKAMSTTWYDTVATLGWLAGITSTVRLMSHVYIATLRHPLRAAKEFSTLDVLSGGRLIIGGMTIEIISVMTFDEDGKIASMKAYWGPDNITSV